MTNNEGQITGLSFIKNGFSVEENNKLINIAEKPNLDINNTVIKFDVQTKESLQKNKLNIFDDDDEFGPPTPPIIDQIDKMPNMKAMINDKLSTNVIEEYSPNNIYQDYPEPKSPITELKLESRKKKEKLKRHKDLRKDKSKERYDHKNEKRRVSNENYHRNKRRSSNSRDHSKERRRKSRQRSVEDKKEKNRNSNDFTNEKRRYSDIKIKYDDESEDLKSYSRPRVNNYYKNKERHTDPRFHRSFNISNDRKRLSDYSKYIRTDPKFARPRTPRGISNCKTNSVMKLLKSNRSLSPANVIGDQNCRNHTSTGVERPYCRRNSNDKAFMINDKSITSTTIDDNIIESVDRANVSLIYQDFKTEKSPDVTPSVINNLMKDKSVVDKMDISILGDKVVIEKVIDQLSFEPVPPFNDHSPKQDKVPQESPIKSCQESSEITVKPFSMVKDHKSIRKRIVSNKTFLDAPPTKRAPSYEDLPNSPGKASHESIDSVEPALSVPPPPDNQSDCDTEEDGWSTERTTSMRCSIHEYDHLTSPIHETNRPYPLVYEVYSDDELENIEVGLLTSISVEQRRIISGKFASISSKKFMKRLHVLIYECLKRGWPGVTFDCETSKFDFNMRFLPDCVVLSIEKLVDRHLN